MNIVNSTETTVIEAFITAPIPAVTKTMHTKQRMAAWPPTMLAKSRIIRANGLVNMPMNSITGMKGTGTLSQAGTSGQKISFQ